MVKNHAPVTIILATHPSWGDEKSLQSIFMHSDGWLTVLEIAYIVGICGWTFEHAMSCLCKVHATTSHGWTKRTNWTSPQTLSWSGDTLHEIVYYRWCSMGIWVPSVQPSYSNAFCSACACHNVTSCLMFLVCEMYSDAFYWASVHHNVTSCF
jgi:hypothetical protein